MAQGRRRRCLPPGASRRAYSAPCRKRSPAASCGDTPEKDPAADEPPPPSVSCRWTGLVCRSVSLPPISTSLVLLLLGQSFVFAGVNASQTCGAFLYLLPLVMGQGRLCTSAAGGAQEGGGRWVVCAGLSILSRSPGPNPTHPSSPPSLDHPTLRAPPAGSPPGLGPPAVAAASPLCLRCVAAASPPDCRTCRVDGTGKDAAGQV
nr:uncharacterized protein LOC127311205 [Lolium perenne]